MSANHPTQSGHPARTPLGEALAARVDAAADAAMAAHHAAVDDRRRIHAAEWDQPDRDTLWDIDEVADTLHGYASWALGGSCHPRIADVRAKLEEFKGAASDLRRKLGEQYPECQRLIDYVSRVEELRAALSDFFDEEARASSKRSDTPPVRPPAAT